MNLPPDPKRYIDSKGSIVFRTPLNWNEIVNRVKNNDLNFGRSKEGLEEYRKFKSQIDNEWCSMENYIKHIYFDYPVKNKIIDGKTLKYVDEFKKLTNGKKEIVLRENDFPYNFTDDIIHWVVWTSSGVPYADVTAKVNEKFPAENFEVVLMENPNKTIKGVDHLHVFARKKYF